MSKPIVNTPGATHRRLFQVLTTDEKSAQLRDEVGFVFSAPRVLPEFLGGTIRLQKGQIVSAVLVGQDQLRDALIEDANLCERELFASLGPDPGTVGWEPRNSPGLGAGKDPEPTIEWSGKETL